MEVARPQVSFTLSRELREIEIIIRYLEERYLLKLSQHIITEHIVNPLYFRDTLNSYLGSAFSIEPILTQSAWFRPHNVSEDIPNLYFVGAGTHPGGGLPGVITSGKIVAQLIDNVRVADEKTDLALEQIEH